jgi:hypothetical protein
LHSMQTRSVVCSMRAPTANLEKHVSNNVDQTFPLDRIRRNRHA